jgi:FAD/FMN-containing dehydrogenase
MYPIAEFCGDLGGIAHSLDPMTIRIKSRDRYLISPLLRQALAGKTADVVVSPLDKDELKQVVTAAARHRIPLTPRGGGTANYGQSVPEHGGILLDMTRMAGVLWVRDGRIRALGGTLMCDIDETARRSGWEVRLHPSTRRHATIAGFIAGGSGGAGGCMWGMLRDRGNILGLEVMSAEESPRILELRGSDVALVHHAYGANAIVTEVEVAAGPAWTWIEALAAFPDYMQAVRFGIALVKEPGIVKKMVSLQEWPIPRLMRDLKDVVPAGQTMANCMVTESCFEAFADMVAEFGGTMVSNHKEGESPYGAPLYEFAFGHGLLQVQKTDPRYTALQGLFVGERIVESIGRVHGEVSGRMPMRLEMMLSQGNVVAMGSPFFIFENAAHMADMVRMMQANGANVANNHASSVKDVGIKQIDERDVAFKKSMDPFNILNPGKLDFGADSAPPADSSLPTQGWAFRKAN